MFGGLTKSASRVALVAAAGILSTSAYAADLGGDCCADLEERVAELEATTARKGNRKVSLTVYGWVNKSIMAWDDGVQSNVYLGVDNINSATRFGFRGDAKVSPSLKAGYSLQLDVTSGALSSSVNQGREEVNAACALANLSTACGVTTWGNDHGIRMRDANVWIESSALGRATLGRYTLPGYTGVIDLGGIGNVASGSQSLVGGGFVFRTSANPLTASATTGALSNAGGQTATVASSTDNLTAGISNRTDGIKWDSPTFMGFVIGAGIGETTKVDRSNFTNSTAATQNGSLGTQYAANLRYAGEFSGVRVAASVGYEVSKAEETFTSVGAATAVARPNSKTLGYGLSAMHVPTGLFIQGQYATFTLGNDDGTSDKSNNWMVQAGISQNWFGIGKTALYGEYSKVSNGNETWAQTAAATTSSDYRMWGLGVNQTIDAAAMELYAGYRNHSLEDSLSTQYKDIGIFLAGARINF